MINRNSFITVLAGLVALAAPLAVEAQAALSEDFTGTSTTAAPGYTFTPVVAGSYTVAMTAVDGRVAARLRSITDSVPFLLP